MANQYDKQFNANALQYCKDYPDLCRSLLFVATLELVHRTFITDKKK